VERHHHLLQYRVVERALRGVVTTWGTTSIASCAMVYKPSTRGGTTDVVGNGRTRPRSSRVVHKPSTRGGVRREGVDKTCKTWKHFTPRPSSSVSHCASTRSRRDGQQSKQRGGVIANECKSLPRRVPWGAVSLRGYIPGAHLYEGRLRMGLVDIIISVSNIGRIKKGAHWQVSDAEPRSACDAAHALWKSRDGLQGVAMGTTRLPYREA